MAVKTSTFSGWSLSGKDAKSFIKQISNPTPNPRAKATIERGKKLAEEYLKTGRVVVKGKKRTKKDS